MEAFKSQDIDQQKIIALLRNGDKMAIELLYDHYSASMYGVAFIITKSEAEAEKILKETFLYAWKHFSTFDEANQNLRLWLLGITRKIAHEQISFDDFLENHDHLNFVNSTRNGRTDNKMTDLQKKVFELAFFGGGKINEIAQYLSKDEHTIKQWLREAIHQYRKELQQA